MLYEWISAVGAVFSYTIRLFDAAAQTGCAARRSFRTGTGKEVIAYWIYQISTVGILLYPFFLHITADFSILFYAGMLFYVIGLTALFITIIHFSFPDDRGLNTKGLYRVSRNPMYVSYFFVL